MSLPLPLLSVAADTAVVVDAVTHYLHRFRVDIASLKRLSPRTSGTYSVLSSFHRWQK